MKKPNTGFYKYQKKTGLPKIIKIKVKKKWPALRLNSYFLEHCHHQQY